MMLGCFFKNHWKISPYHAPRSGEPEYHKIFYLGYFRDLLHVLGPFLQWTQSVPGQGSSPPQFVLTTTLGEAERVNGHTQGHTGSVMAQRTSETGSHLSKINILTTIFCTESKRNKLGRKAGVVVVSCCRFNLMVD